MLLPVPYFLLTFTLPDVLRKAARSHQKLFYNLLFRVSAAAPQKLAQDPRFIGGQVGMTGVLHTWGRTLAYHPHVHYLAPHIFRAAISNHRIVKITNQQVTFRCTATDTGKARRCNITAEEFIRRFLQHVLPKGFVKVGYYGFFSPGLRPRLATLREILNPSILDEPWPEVTQQPGIVPTPQQEDGPHTFVCCPSCAQPIQRQRSISPLGCRPP